jgi:hypothetical protein
MASRSATSTLQIEVSVDGTPPAMTPSTQSWNSDDEAPPVVRRASIAMSVALEVVAELRARERDRGTDPMGKAPRRRTSRG